MSSSAERAVHPDVDGDLVKKYERLLREYTERAAIEVNREMREGKYGPALQEFASAAPPRHSA